MDTLIILTTTVYINPNKYYIFQNNSEERINVYLSSIKQWLNKTNFKILVVDNSGYPFNEFEENDRFQIISFKENELPEASYLLNNNSKGASELFSINYSFNNCKFNFVKNVIKVTGRYFIPNFEEYLKEIEIFGEFDIICQNDLERCEMLGCNKLHFESLFNTSLQLNDQTYCNNLEDLYMERKNLFNKILICKEFEISPTQRGGINKINYFL